MSWGYIRVTLGLYRDSGPRLVPKRVQGLG